MTPDDKREIVDRFERGELAVVIGDLETIRAEIRRLRRIEAAHERMERRAQAIIDDRSETDLAHYAAREILAAGEGDE